MRLPLYRSKLFDDSKNRNWNWNKVQVMEQKTWIGNGTTDSQRIRFLLQIFITVILGKLRIRSEAYEDESFVLYWIQCEHVQFCIFFPSKILVNICNLYRWIGVCSQAQKRSLVENNVNFLKYTENNLTLV